MIWVGKCPAVDVVYLKSGTTLQGEVIKPDQGIIDLQLPSGITLKLSEKVVDRIEWDMALNSADHRNTQSGAAQRSHQQLMNWLRRNVSPKTLLPFSFYIPVDRQSAVYATMGERDSITGIIERSIVREGLEVYDGALWQIVLTRLGDRDDLARAGIPLNVYWQGNLGGLSYIRAGFPAQPFIYNLHDPAQVSSNLEQKGNRGFVFRIINANGSYHLRDPLDGKAELKGFPNWDSIHWEDWKPIAGENAWLVLASLQLYHAKYYDRFLKRYVHGDPPVELRFAQELSRVARILQADNGGIRMAPLGTFGSGHLQARRKFVGANPEDPHSRLRRKELLQGALQTYQGESSQEVSFAMMREEYQWHYDEVSTENNLSWYAAFRMLYEVTGHVEYRETMERIEDYFRSAWDPQEHVFYQGMHHFNGHWIPNNLYFASDVQNWAIIVIGPEKLDHWFGEGSAFQMWRATREKSGYWDDRQHLLGVGFTEENDRISIEWTAGAILAARLLYEHYQQTHLSWAAQAAWDARTMRKGIERFRYDISQDEAAYSYSSRRGWIPFGWFSHTPDVLSMASTCWILLIDQNINPFSLN
jgi:hypothetical protein